MSDTATRSFPPEHDGVTSVTPEGRAVIRFERQLRHPVERVWAAITEPGEVVGWLAHRVNIELRIGGDLVLWLGDSRSSDPVWKGTITQLEPLQLLEAVFDDGSILRFELSPSATGSKLSFSDTRPVNKRSRNSVAAGWHLRMDQLPDHLDGHRTDWLSLDENRGEHGYVAAIEEIYWHYRNKPRPALGEVP